MTKLLPLHSTHRRSIALASMATMATLATLATLVAAASVAPSQAQVVTQRNLVSDGSIPAEHVDPLLVNAWGLVPNPAANGFWWLSAARTGVSTLYDGNGNINSLVVTIPSAAGPRTPGAPTGIVFNGGSSFVVSSGAASGPARFLFASEDGTISGWAPAVPPPPPATAALIVVDESAAGAIYKGLALGATPAGPRLYVTDFHNGTVEAYDGTFAELELAGGFVDPTLPAGYAPFGIAAFGDKVYVTYALQDERGEDDVPGTGHGFINVFDTEGQLVTRLVSEDVLDSPWGLAIAPPNFGSLSGALLVSNFGDGWVNAFDPVTGASLGPLFDSKGGFVAIEGLWGISFGTGGWAGPNNTLFFTAGPGDEKQGLFGRLDLSTGQLSDFDGDGDVNAADLDVVLGGWGASGHAGDINGDGVVGSKDLALVLGAWGPVFP